jgi:ATP-dependent RNA helicase RhlE
VHPVDRDRKADLLTALIRRNDWRQVLVFARTKHGADKLTRRLNADAIRALAIHGNKSQSLRTRELAEFKAGDLRVLVATDIAARGIDIQELPHVVNYDLPNVPEDYVHRIGRTGRAGATGEAISLVCVDEHAFLRDIERLLRRPIRREVISGFEPDANAVAQPVFTQRGHGRDRMPRPAPRSGGGGERGQTHGGRHAQPPSRRASANPLQKREAGQGRSDAHARDATGRVRVSRG